MYLKINEDGCIMCIRTYQCNLYLCSTLTPGYFNDDTVLDFLVKYQFGPGFPVYYYAKVS